jgi:methylmalonyl-CoA mutase C-terminal domain/subunit
VEKRRIRILLAKVGLDGHDRGVKVLASLLRDAGLEVIYLGMYNTPEMVVKSAIEEDVDVIGISFLSGEHLTLTPKIVKEMKKNHMDDVLLIIGGIMPAQDEPKLIKMGVDRVFRGSLVRDVVSYLEDRIQGKGTANVASH